MIGTTQTLIFGGVTLTLSDRNFDGDSFGGIGYRRSRVQEHLISVSESFYGASIVDGPFFPPKYEFEWQLWLRQEDLLKLLAIIDGQQNSPRTQGSIPCRLRDQRLPLLVKTPRSRAKVGTTGITAPTGHEVIWPQFDLLLTPSSDLWEWYLHSGGDLYRVKFSGRELALVGVGADL